MRLIDADALLEEIKSIQVVVTGLRTGKGFLNECMNNYRESVLRAIDEQPTSYDPDKVVSEIRRDSGNWYRDIDGDYVPPMIETEKAIKIVKKGGVDKDCNNCDNYTEPDEVDNGCYLCCKGYENNYKPKADNGGVADDVCEWKKSEEYPFYWIVLCDGCEVNHRQGDYCPRCGKKIKVVE